MSGIDKYVEFTYKIHWKIKNYALRPDPEKGEITSPKFEVKCLVVTPWTLSLFPKGNAEDGFMQFQVHRNFFDKESGMYTPKTEQLESIMVKYSVHILDGEKNKRFEIQSDYKDCTESSPATLPKDFMKLKDFSNDNLQNGALIVICELKLKVDQIKFLTPMSDYDLLLLSENILGLYMTPKFPNLTMYSLEKIPFLVHRPILQARWPSVLTECYDLRQTIINGEIHTSIPALALDVVLLYVYSQGGVSIPDDLKDEMMAVAIRYRMIDLEQILSDYPIEYDLRTDLIIEELNFTFSLTEVKWEDSSFSRVCIMNSPNTGVSDLIVTLSTAPDSEHLNVSFQFSNFNETIVLMKGSMSLLSSEMQELTRCDFQHTYTSDEEWLAPPFVSKSEFSKETSPHYLKCEVFLSENLQDRRVVSKLCRIEVVPRILFVNLLSFSEQLGHLYFSQQGADLKLCFRGEYYFCHKCILLCRSERIRMLLSDSDVASQDMIEMFLPMPVLSQEAFGLALVYMYTGKVKLENVETAKRLKESALYFGLPLLYKKCEEYVNRSLLAEEMVNVLEQKNADNTSLNTETIV